MENRTEIEEEIIKKAAQDAAFLKKLKENPKQLIAEFLPEGRDIPEGISINVIQETPNELTIVLPPSLNEKELSANELDQVSGGYDDHTTESYYHDNCW